MGLTEDARLLETIAASPQLRTPDETEALLDPMPLAELASMWSALQSVNRGQPLVDLCASSAQAHPNSASNGGHQGNRIETGCP
jgi:hypothetical protein